MASFYSVREAMSETECTLQSPRISDVSSLLDLQGQRLSEALCLDQSGTEWQDRTGY